MFKRVLLVAAISFAVGELVVLGMQMSPRFGWFSSGSADTEAAHFENVLRLVNKNYVSDVKVSYKQLTDAALNGMLNSLDPHSEFLDQTHYKELTEETSQQFGGIGVQIEMRHHQLTVIAPIEGTPGQRAGLASGDRIVKIGDKPAAPLTIDDCLKLLRGKPGAAVDLTIFRPSTNKTFVRHIVREVIHVDNVKDVHMLTKQIGYIQLVEFGAQTGSEFLAALRKLEGQGMKALVLDLRNNPGGLLDAAREVAQPFFKKGALIVSTRGRTPASHQEIRSENPGPPRTYPIAVIVNSGSASAAEIVAGALRDTHKAVIVGERSFGKGSVQTILPIDQRQALRLTTALYYTPANVRIQGKGVVPEIPVTLTNKEDRDLALQRSRLDVMTPAEFTKRFGHPPVPDPQLQAAKDALKGVLIYEASQKATAPDVVAAE